MNRKAEEVTFSSKWFIALAAFNLLAAAVNHIDDTDETYGYWEPLHYLLYGKGMQTWEYDPVFAIRSYAFLFPMYMIGNLLRSFGMEKISLFYLLRCVLGLFTTYSQYSYLRAIHNRYSSENAETKHSLSSGTAIFLLLSPGIFYTGTSFLPSAISTTLTMLSLARWLDGYLPESILWGSLAVLGTGWPFVGLIFLPLGLHMLGTSYYFGGIYQVMKLCVYGIVMVIFVLLPVTAIDFIYYQQPTVPFWNILTYNTGNRGDELYGIEPVSYYVKNLLLTTGLAFPLTCGLFLFETVQYLFSFVFSNAAERKKNAIDSEMWTMCLSTILWLGVLFSRPHKEERFLYPIYPFLAFLAARALFTIFRSARMIWEGCTPYLSLSTKQKVGQYTHWVVYRGLCLCMFLLFASRTLANFRNYHGYIALWQDLHPVITQSAEYQRLQERQKLQATKKGKISSDSEESIRICVGSEWHLFPTHFFLPYEATLYYIEDGFHGILPQHYERIDGTFRNPPLPNNGDNQEEPSRYIELDECHFIVTSNDGQSIANRLPLSSSVESAATEDELDQDNDKEEENIIDLDNTNSDGSTGKSQPKKTKTKTTSSTDSKSEGSPYSIEVVQSRLVLNRDATNIPAYLRALFVPAFLVRPPTSAQNENNNAKANSAKLSSFFKAYQILKVVNGGHQVTLKKFTTLKPPPSSSSSTTSKKSATEKAEKVGEKVASSLLKNLEKVDGLPTKPENIQVKNDMTKEQLVERLGLAWKNKKNKKKNKAEKSDDL